MVFVRIIIVALEIRGRSFLMFDELFSFAFFAHFIHLTILSKEQQNLMSMSFSLFKKLDRDRSMKQGAKFKKFALFSCIGF